MDQARTLQKYLLSCVSRAKLETCEGKTKQKKLFIRLDKKYLDSSKSTSMNVRLRGLFYFINVNTLIKLLVIFYCQRIIEE